MRQQVRSAKSVQDIQQGVAVFREEMLARATGHELVEDEGGARVAPATPKGSVPGPGVDSKLLPLQDS